MDLLSTEPCTDSSLPRQMDELTSLMKAKIKRYGFVRFRPMTSKFGSSKTQKRQNPSSSVSSSTQRRVGCTALPEKRKQKRLADGKVKRTRS
jgi:hypothetical protein